MKYIPRGSHIFLTHTDDASAITALIKYYKKVYERIALIIALVGLAICPFIDHIVGKTDKFVNFKIVFLFYLVDTITSYLLTYKRSIIYANQKSYYTTIIHTICVLVMNLLQIYILVKWGNYYLYLAVRIVFRLMENIGINILANKLYPYIKTKAICEIEDAVRKDIMQKVKGLLFHRIGTFLVSGSDNIIITMLPVLGLVWSGRYANYLMITNQLNAMVLQVFSAITASIGNLLVTSNQEKNYQVFKQIDLLNVWLCSFVAVNFYYLSFPFVELWMGKEYVFSESLVVLLSVNLFLNGLRKSYSTFKDAAGIFYEDRYVPLVESVLNIIVSVYMGMKIGIAGVFVGTILSHMVLFLYSYPKYVYSKLFGKNLNVYFQGLFRSFFVFTITFIVTYLVMNFIHTKELWLELILKCGIGILVPNIVIYLCMCKTYEFREVCKKLKGSMNF